MESDFRYAKILDYDGSQLKSDVEELARKFPRQSDSFFPQRLKRGETVPFTVYRESQLHDWDSITRWCDVEQDLLREKHSISLAVGTTVPGASLKLLPILPDLYAHDVSYFWSGEGRVARRDTGIGIELDPSSNGALTLYFKHPSEVAKVKEENILKKFWSACQSQLPFLSGSQFLVSKDSADASFKVTLNDESELFCKPWAYTVTDSLAIKNSLAQLPALLGIIGTFLPDYEESFSCVLKSELALKASAFFTKTFGTHTLFYTARMHKDFHPDQLLGQTPTEGYWQIPMFRIHPGRHEESEATIFLIQTDSQRFFEIQTSDHHSAKDLNAYLAKYPLDLPITFWEGPNNTRWGLDKLRKR